MAIALLGTAVSKGIAIGRVRFLRRNAIDIPEYLLPPDRIEDEVARFHAALDTASAQLEEVRHRIPRNAPEEIAAFIDTHLLMLEDTAFVAGPIELIRHLQCNAEWALKQQEDALLKVFDQMDDPYLKTRRDDVRHVVRRVQRILLSATAPQKEPEGGKDEVRVIFADDIAPSEMQHLHQQNACAVVCEHGGPLSHSAILARSLELPAVFGVREPERYLIDNELVVVDGHRGVLLAGLDAAALTYFQERRDAERRRRAALRKLKDVPAISRDGVAITLRANIDLPDELPALRRVGAAGIGLFRTEFLYMNRREPPDEEEQFRIYRRVVERLRGAPLTIRTLDIGVDKQPGMDAAHPCSHSPLGLRAIRLCLKDTHLFLPQIRAILRASAYGPVRMLIPMLTSGDESAQILNLLETTKRQLARKKIPFDAGMPVGAMIEVPAAALCADCFAHQLDFLSIGTNDLIQYTLAIDRMDDQVKHLFDPLHPAVLRLLELTIAAGTAAGVPVAMCGEMASDPHYTRLLLGMGLREFSVPPSALPEIKRIIIESDLQALRKAVPPLLSGRHPDGLEPFVQQLNEGLP